ncbi:SUMO ligase siz1 [Entophlyctis sp. JEL0112]|nr:SUMO ligase siz1 [Entophlyctis sp. JEL0112]
MSLSTWLNRTNAVFSFFSSVFFAVLAAVAVTGPVLIYSTATPSVHIAMAKASVRVGKLYFDHSNSPAELATVHFDLNADLSPLFNWNTKQLFVQLVAEYSTESHVFNQVTLWDDIIPSKEKSLIRLKKKKAEYLFSDISNKVGGLTANLSLHWDIMPHVGILLHDSSVPTLITIPEKLEFCVHTMASLPPAASQLQPQQLPPEAQHTPIDPALQQMYSDISRLTVPKIKEVLKMLNERVGGNRPEVVMRLRTAIQQRSARPERLAECRVALDKVLNVATSVTSTTASPQVGEAAQTPRIRLPALATESPRHTNVLLPNVSSLAGIVASPSRTSQAPFLQPYFNAYSMVNSAPNGNAQQTNMAATSSLKVNLDAAKFRSSPFYTITTKLVSKAISGAVGRDTVKFGLGVDALARISAGEVLLLFVGPANAVPIGPNPFKQTGIPVEYPILKGSHSNAPNHCYISINGTVIPPALYAGIRGKPWTAKPLEMNKFVSNVPNELNTIDLIFTPINEDIPPVIAIFVQMAKPVPLETVVENLRRDSLLSKEAVLAERRQKFISDEDISLTEEHVSLKDPSSRQRIRTAIRGKLCRHPQCFDFEFYLMMNKTHPTWTCPVCSKIAPLNDVFVDGYFMELLDAAAHDPDIESAEIEANGTWRLNIEDARENKRDHSDSDDDEYPRKRVKMESSAVAAPKSADVIDLTLSDDDDTAESSRAVVQPSGPPIHETMRIESPAQQSRKRPSLANSVTTTVSSQHQQQQQPALGVATSGFALAAIGGPASFSPVRSATTGSNTMTAAAVTLNTSTVGDTTPNLQQQQLLHPLLLPVTPQATDLPGGHTSTPFAHGLSSLETLVYLASTNGGEDVFPSVGASLLPSNSATMGPFREGGSNIDNEDDGSDEFVI